MRVSIPKRVTAKVEHSSPQWERPLALVSIPKRVTAKVEPVSESLRLPFSRFQSLKGLQPKWNDSRKISEAIDRVSIPKRVTAKVER